MIMKINYRKTSAFAIMIVANFNYFSLHANKTKQRNNEQYSKQRIDFSSQKEKINISAKSITSTRDGLTTSNKDCIDAEKICGKISARLSSSQYSNSNVNPKTSEYSIQDKLDEFVEHQKKSATRDNKIVCGNNFFNLENADKNIDFKDYTSISDICFYKDGEGSSHYEYMYIKGINNSNTNNVIKNIRIENNGLTDLHKEQMQFAHYCTENIMMRSIEDTNGKEFKLIFGDISKEQANNIVWQLRKTLESGQNFSSWTKKLKELIPGRDNSAQIMQLFIVTSLNETLSNNSTSEEYYKLKVNKGFHEFTTECRLKTLNDSFIIDKLMPLFDECDDLKSIQSNDLIDYGKYSLDKHIDSITKFMIKKLKAIKNDKERDNFISGFVDSVARAGYKFDNKKVIQDEDFPQWAKYISNFINSDVNKYLNHKDLSEIQNKILAEDESITDKNDAACMILRAIVSKLLRVVIPELDTMRYIIKSLTDENVLKKIKEIGRNDRLGLEKSEYIKKVSARVNNVFGNDSQVSKLIRRLEDKKISGYCSYNDLARLLKDDSSIVTEYYKSFIYGNCAMFGIGSNKILLQEYLDNDMKNKANKTKIEGLKNIDSYLEDMSGIKVNFTRNYLHNLGSNSRIQLKNSYILTEKDNIQKFSEAIAYEYAIRKTAYEYILKQVLRFRDMRKSIIICNECAYASYNKYSSLSFITIKKRKKNRSAIEDALKKASQLESLELGLNAGDVLSFGIQGTNVGQLRDTDFKYSTAEDIQDVEKNYDNTNNELDTYGKYESETNLAITKVMKEVNLMNSNNEGEMKEKLNQQISQNTQEMNKINARINNDTDQLGQIDEQIKNLEAQLEQRRKARETVNANISGLRKKITSLEELIASLRNKDISLPNNRDTMLEIQKIISNIRAYRETYGKSSSRSELESLSSTIVAEIKKYKEQRTEIENTITKAIGFRKKLIQSINSESQDYAVSNDKSQKLYGAINSLCDQDGYKEFMMCVRNFATSRETLSKAGVNANVKDANSVAQKCEMNLKYLNGNYFKNQGDKEIITDIFTNGMTACTQQSVINDNKENFVSDINKIIEVYSVLRIIEMTKHSEYIKELVKKIENKAKRYFAKSREYKENINTQIEHFHKTQKKPDDMVLIS